MNKELKEQLLEHYPKEYHELLQKQLLAITDTIEKNKMKYTYSNDFKNALDIVVVDILNGKFLGINPLDKINNKKE